MSIPPHFENKAGQRLIVSNIKTQCIPSQFRILELGRVKAGFVKTNLKTQSIPTHFEKKAGQR